METKETQCHPKPAVNATCLLGEKGCYENGKCHYIGNCEHKVLTNADRIRAMSDEELAQVLSYNCTCREFCHECVAEKDMPNCPGDSIKKWTEWLKQPADMRGEEDG